MTAFDSPCDSDFKKLLQPDYEGVYSQVQFQYSPLPISIPVWRQVILTTQRMQLSPHLLTLGISKQNWLQLFAEYKKVTGYLVDAESTLFGHWVMYLRLESSDNSIHHAKMDLKCHKLTDNSPYFGRIFAANYGEVRVGNTYILTNFSVDSRLAETPPPYNTCNVPWTDMWVSYGLDEQHFKPYNQICNNCRQFLQRVCRRVDLSVESDILDENLANKLRSETYSPQTWYEWTWSAVAGMFYSTNGESSTKYSED